MQYEVNNKEDVLELLSQLQNKYNITKNDINENFNNKISSSGSSSNQKIRIITIEEAIKKIIVPLNSYKLWNNRIEEYPETGRDSNGRWCIWYWHDWGHTRNSMNKIQNFYYRGNRSDYGVCCFLPEYPTRNYGGHGPSMIYQDNLNNCVDVRNYNTEYNYISHSGCLGSDERNYGALYIYKSNVEASYRGFFPVFEI